MSEEVRANNKRLVLHMLVVAVFFGSIEGLMRLPDPTPLPLSIAEGVSMNFILFYWFAVDSRIRDYKASGLLKVLVVGFSIVPLCWYIIRSRGLRGSIRSFLFALAFFFFAVLTWGLTGLLASEFTERTAALLEKLT